MAFHSYFKRRTIMKVYVLVFQAPDDIAETIGVFSTPEKATAVVRSSGRPEQYFSTEEHELDAPTSGGQA